MASKQEQAAIDLMLSEYPLKRRVRSIVVSPHLEAAREIVEAGYSLDQATDFLSRVYYFDELHKVKILHYVAKIIENHRKTAKDRDKMPKAPRRPLRAAEMVKKFLTLDPHAQAAQYLLDNDYTEEEALKLLYDIRDLPEPDTIKILNCLRDLLRESSAGQPRETRRAKPV